MRKPVITLMLLISATWICGCQNKSDTELAQARAEAEAARAELARLQSTVSDSRDDAAGREAARAEPAQSQATPPPEIPSQRKVSGELYASTQGGDVRKGAGVKVYLIPITSAVRELVTDAHGRFLALDTAYERFMRDLDAKYPRRNEFSPGFSSFEKAEVDMQGAAYDVEFREYLDKHNTSRAREIDQGFATLLAGGQASTANSDGRFEFHVPNGEYLLLTEQKSFAKEKLLWFSRIEVRGQDVSLSLDQKSAVFGASMSGLSPNLDSLDVQFRDLVKAVQPLIAADLGDQVQASQQREADSLEKAIAMDPVRDARPAQVVAPEAAPASPPTESAPEATSTLTEAEIRMQVIFRDWAKQRGAALKKASKMSKSAAESYMRRIDQGLVKSLTKKYAITHEELDRIEAYGAMKDWWERE